MALYIDAEIELLANALGKTHLPVRNALSEKSEMKCHLWNIFKCHKLRRLCHVTNGPR